MRFYFLMRKLGLVKIWIGPTIHKLRDLSLMYSMLSSLNLLNKKSMLTILPS